MTDITIPPEAFTAAELAYTEALSNGEDPIRAACLAMLENWPGAWQTVSRQGVLASRTAPPAFIDVPQIILPLTQEKTNAT